MGLITALFTRAQKIDGPRIIRVVVALAMLLYALGFLTRPETGIPAYIDAAFGVSPHTMALLFAFCAGALLFSQHPSPLTFTILTTPMALYSLASVAFVLLSDQGNPTAIAGHFGLWLVVNIFNWLEVVAYERH
jgi:hypothetical protein